MPGRIIVIGASLSGIDALCELVACFPANFPAPIFITQHVAPHSPGMLPHILSNVGKLPEALAALEGTDPDDKPHVVSLTAAKVDAGRRLVGKSAFGCVSCHDLAGLASSDPQP